MGITPFLLRRYLLPREGNLLSFVLWISVVGVALGIAVLILVLSVMSGFQKFLEERYTRITSDLVVLPKQTQESKISIEDTLKNNKEIAAYSPFLMGQAMIFTKSVGGAVLEGIDLESISRVVPLKEIFFEEPNLALQTKTDHWIWLGKGLAEKLKAKVGDDVNVMVGEGGNGTVPFKVTGITKFGIYEHDLRYAYIDINLLKNYFHKNANSPYYKIALYDHSAVNRVAVQLKEKFSNTASIKKWSDINQNIFLAVAHQKQMLFVVLEIIVALAGVNVINLLMMSSHYRRRDTAILRAMGMRFSSVLSFFIVQGAAVGFVGVLLGVGIGISLSEIIKRWQPTLLSESVYNVTQLPIQIVPTDLLLICSVAFVLCIIFSVVPALKAAKARPVHSLRME